MPFSLGARRLVFVGSLAGVVTVRHLWPGGVAEAKRPVVVDTARVMPAHGAVLGEVLRQVRQIDPAPGEPEDDAGDTDDGDPVTGGDIESDGPKLDADGLTDEERWEGDVAVIEDKLKPAFGAVQGQVRDAGSGEPLAGVTVVVTSPALQGAQTAITDENGHYAIVELPVGSYLTTFYYMESTIERSDVEVADRAATPVFQRIDTQPPPRQHEVIYLEDEDFVIDPTSTVQGITIDKNYIKNLPVPGRIFESTIGVSAGSQVDSYGVDLDDATEGANEGANDNDDQGSPLVGRASIENTYYIVDE